MHDAISHASRWVDAANRGEIARRVFATCRRLGIGTVAVYTDPDAASPHVAEADARVRLEGTRGYLDAAQLIAAARAAGADAIHPGYGFLSENAEFAAAVADAGLTWIGPPVAAVAAMGSKIEAKKMMAAAGVPVLDELDPDTVTADQSPGADQGVGRRRRPRHAGGRRTCPTLPGQVEAARREAQSAFGDPTVFCERYLATGHHVEVQVMADEHGTVWAVGERECSIQRRHQKIIEEAPSPLVERTEGMRAKLFEAARLAAEAIGYTGAGTVEFMADDDGDFFFLEMNTRLQVEHPVTEATTGLDLVELQLHVADGGRLAPNPRRARIIRSRPGSTPRTRPRTGSRRRAPCTASRCPPRARIRCSDGPGCALDSGIVDGSEVSIFYDPMLAKVISCAPTATAGRGRPRRRAGPHPPPRRAHQPRPAGQRAAPPGVPRRRHRHRVLRHPRPRPAWPHRWPTTAPSRLSALAAALADAAHEPRQRNGVRRPRRAAGATWRRVTRPSATSTRPATSTTCATGSPAAGVRPARPRRRARWCRRHPDRVVLAVDGVGARRSTSPATATTCSSTRRWAPSRLSRCRASPDPDAAVAQGSLLAPDARAR